MLALFLLFWVRLEIPDFAGQAARQQLPIRRTFVIPGVRPVLAALFAWILAHNTLYTYIAPFLASMGLGARVDAVLLLFGVSSIAGIEITGSMVDRRLRALTLLSLAIFTVGCVLLGLSAASPWLVLAGVAAWGVTFGGAPTLLQTALADAAGDEADAAQSMLVTIFNLAVAGGGMLGGLLLKHLQAGFLPWIVAVLALSGLTVVWSAGKHGFKPGRRAMAH